MRSTLKVSRSKTVTITLHNLLVCPTFFNSAISMLMGFIHPLGLDTPLSSLSMVSVLPTGKHRIQSILNPCSRYQLELGMPPDSTFQAKREGSSYPLMPPGIPVAPSGPRPNNTDLNQSNAFQDGISAGCTTPKFKQGQAPTVTIDTTQVDADGTSSQLNPKMAGLCSMVESIMI